MRAERLCNKLLSSINDILDFSKVESGKLALEQASFSLDKLLDSLSGLAIIRSQGLKVLAVDDNAAACEILGSLCQQFDFDVTVARSGPDALARMDAAERSGHPYEGLLIDWKMPVMDGYTATRLLRQQPRFVRLPVCP